MLDGLDHRLIQALIDEPRASYRRLARLAGTTAPTAIARIGRLQDIGAVRVETRVPEWVGMDAAPARDPARPTCHQCRGPLPTAPVEARLGERWYLFCCATCEGKMRERLAKLEGPPRPGPSSTGRPTGDDDTQGH